MRNTPSEIYLGSKSRWAILASVSTFYLLLYLLVDFWVLSNDYSYPDYILDRQAHPLIESVYGIAFKFRWLAYLVMAAIISPWGIAQKIYLQIIPPTTDSQSQSTQLDIPQKRNKTTKHKKNKTTKHNLVSGIRLAIGYLILTVAAFIADFWEYIPFYYTQIIEAILNYFFFVLLLLFFILTLIGVIAYPDSSPPKTRVASTWIVSVMFLGLYLVFARPLNINYWAEENVLSLVIFIDILISLWNLVIDIKNNTSLNSNIEHIISDKDQIWDELYRNIQMPRLRVSKIRRTNIKSSIRVFEIIGNLLFGISVGIVNSFISLAKSVVNHIIAVILESTGKLFLSILSIFINFLVVYLLHMIYTIKFLPIFIWTVLKTITRVAEVVLRYIHLPLVLLFVSALSVHGIVDNAIAYFYTGEKSFLLGLAVSLIIYLASMIWAICLIFESSFERAFNFYFHKLSELLVILMFLFVPLSWLLIGLDSWILRTEHFKPGVLTWSGTGLLTLVILFILLSVLLFPNKREKREISSATSSRSRTGDELWKDEPWEDE